MKRVIVSVLAGAFALACATPPPTPAKKPATQPAEPAKPAPTAEDWRKAPPAAGPQPEIKLPAFERDRLKNGLTVLVSSNRALPLVSFILVTRGGAATDPDGQAGLTSFGYKLLGEGAGRRDALAFSDAVADLGAGFSTGADADKGTIRISGLVRNTDALLKLLADAALRPRLRKKDFTRVKAQSLATIARNRGSPQGLAMEFTPAMIYGERHPYGHPAGGTETSVKAITLAKTRRHLAKILTPGSSALIAVGDIDLKSATKLAKKYFRRWKGRRRPPPRHPAVEATKREQVIIVHKENSPQTMIILGRPIFGIGSPNEVPLGVTNQIYGGSFTARLNMNLREAKGYTYGAFSWNSLRQGVGAFLASSRIRQDVTAAGLAEFFAEMTSMTERPPDATELSRAKDGLIKSLPGKFETNGAAAGAATALFVYDLPLDRYARRPAEVAAVDGKQVADMANAYLSGDVMKVLLVGDAPVIKDAVEKLGLGEVIVRTP